jgi:hypothetical protein
MINAALIESPVEPKGELDQSLNRCSKRYEGLAFFVRLFQQLLFLASAILAHPKPAANEHTGMLKFKPILGSPGDIG